MSNEREHAIALLATVRGVMTGAEIELCDRLVEEADDWTPYDRPEDRDMLTVLETQFAAEIANHMAGKGAAS